MPAPRRVVANLPYNISVPLLLGWLRRIDAFAGFTLMFQKEVAARLAAGPGSRHYGRLSVIAGWLCEVRTEFDVSARAFTPPPKVTSTVVTLTPRPAPLASAAWEDLEARHRGRLRPAAQDAEVLAEAARVGPGASRHRADGARRGTRYRAVLRPRPRPAPEAGIGPVGLVTPRRRAGAHASPCSSGSAVRYLTCFRAKLEVMLLTPGMLVRWSMRKRL